MSLMSKEVVGIPHNHFSPDTTPKQFQRTPAAEGVMPATPIGAETPTENTAGDNSPSPS